MAGKRLCRSKPIHPLLLVHNLVVLGKGHHELVVGQRLVLLHIFDRKHDLHFFKRPLDGHRQRVLAALKILVAGIEYLRLQVALAVIDILLVAPESISGSPVCCG
jgi:hypothetical protein